MKLIPELVLIHSQHILPRSGGKHANEEKAKTKTKERKQNELERVGECLSVLCLANQCSARAVSIKHGSNAVCEHHQTLLPLS